MMSTLHRIDPDALSAAIIELNSMSHADGVIMSRDGSIRCGYLSDEDYLCMLIAAPTLARQLTASGLSSYSAKELKAWVDSYDTAPLQAILESFAPAN